ncbi:Predicted Na+-dependent transporter [Paenibacillus sophorae]|uniref:Bile acid:sodium symporter family protein n=1 Tax=Paenibacillus sophorae TaxID=1333845 RepID=A0A1H8U838_9BACL|nr:bile acid:sodium symporter family protein [Paenibacillus sophorae]QWU17991.1 bile acid:sodium symporter family protein [Paenibacillus sophorae]SEO99246.1 Predicted Na+-dependent transporter [Paenibacillus sophorae]
MSIRNGLVKSNSFLEKIMPLLTPSAIVFGVLNESRLLPYTWLVPWIFAMMTLVGSLKSNIGDLFAVLAKPSRLIVLMIILHVVMPVVGWLAALAVFPDDPYTVTGYVLLFAIPTGVVSVVWVSIYGGNIALTLALILIDTLLSPVIVPGTLHLLMGTSVEIRLWDLMKGLLYMVVAPSLLGMLLNQWTKGKVNTVYGPPLAPFVKVGLFAVVSINGASIARYLKHPDSKLLVIIAVTFVTVVLGYIIGALAARRFRWNYEDSVAVQFNAGMRNLSAGAVLAVKYFPPAVALPVISGMLFQQILAALSGLVLRIGAKRSAESRTALPVPEAPRSL